jgi:DNA-binding NarL/FixJ family response regulator
VQELEGALQSLVTSAASYAPPAVIRALATRAVSANRVPTAARSSPSLSAREKEILSLISRGDTNSEVAQKLGISVNTVRTHLQTLSSKLNVSGRVNLAGMAWSIALGEDGEAPAAKHAPRQSSASGVRGGAAG